MKRLLPLFALGVLAPVVASAITIEPGDLYTDVRETSPDASGINLLTREGVVQGIGDGYFGPSRPVNRAEFLKIAILSTPEDRRPSTSPRDCFPDVHASDWFSGTVCGAKDLGIVRGNADPKKSEDQWLFFPAERVQYDAALKMLTLLFGYEVRPAAAGEDWGQPYFEAARARGVDLPVPIRFDTELTRGMAARLAASFLAEHHGMLDELRLAESGIYGSSESSTSSSSESSSVTSSVSSSSSSSSIGLFTVPSVHHFLLLGEPSDAIAHGTISPQPEEMEIAAVQAKLFQEARSLEGIDILREDGTLIARMPRRTTTDTGDYLVTFEKALSGSGTFTVPANTALPLVLRAVVRSETNDGFSENLVHVRLFSLTLRGKQTNTTYNVPFLGPFPKHQTSLGRIVSVQRTSPETAQFETNPSATILTFDVGIETVGSATLAPSQFVFTYEKDGTDTLLTNWRLKRTDTGSEASCSINTTEKTVSCANLQTQLGTFANGKTSFALLAHVEEPPSASNERFQIFLPSVGTPESLGSLWWTDSVGTFRWVEGNSPLLTGTLWTN